MGGRGARALLWLVVALVLALALVLSTGREPANAQPASKDSAKSNGKHGKSDGKGEVLVKFKKGTSEGRKDETVRAKGDQVVEEISALDIKVISVGEEADEDSADDDYEADENVEYAVPNDRYQAIQTNPYTYGATDTRFGEQWQYNNTGQLGGKSGADIDAIDAWNATAGGSSGIKIAVLDTGIKKAHPDLQGKVATGDEKNFTTSSTLDDVQGHGGRRQGQSGADRQRG